MQTAAENAELGCRNGPMRNCYNYYWARLGKALAIRSGSTPIVISQMPCWRGRQRLIAMSPLPASAKDPRRKKSRSQRRLR